MTKHILHRFREGGIPAADEAIREEAGELFATEDLQRAVKTFLEQGGPGHASSRAAEPSGAPYPPHTGISAPERNRV